MKVVMVETALSVLKIISKILNYKPKLFFRNKRTNPNSINTNKWPNNVKKNRNKFKIKSHNKINRSLNNFSQRKNSHRANWKENKRRNSSLKYAKISKKHKLIKEKNKSKNKMCYWLKRSRNKFKKIRSKIKKNRGKYSNLTKLSKN